MKSYATPVQPLYARDWILSGMRIAMGTWFIYGGFVKGLHPVDFLKTLHEYELPVSFVTLNAIAALLPWFEVFCGAVLLTGKALRATSAIWLAMLIPFTALIFYRALGVQNATQVAFCSIRFDCGCGTGEQPVCLKLTENLLLIITASLMFLQSRHASPKP